MCINARRHTHEQNDRNQMFYRARRVEHASIPRPVSHTVWIGEWGQWKAVNKGCVCVSVSVFVCTPYYPDTSNIVLEDGSVLWILERQREHVWYLKRKTGSKTDRHDGVKGLRDWGKQGDGWWMEGWRGERELYKGLDSASFLSVSKQLTIEGQRRRKAGRR